MVKNTTKVTFTHHDPNVGVVTGIARRPKADYDAAMFEPHWLRDNPPVAPPLDTWIVVQDHRGDFCAYDDQVTEGNLPK